MTDNEFLDLVIATAAKFILKVETGRARSVETYADMKRLQHEALKLKRPAVHFCVPKELGVFEDVASN